MNSLAVSRRSLLASTILAMSAPAFAATRMPYRDPRAPIASRVADLLGRMTLDEKVAQLRCMWMEKAKLYDDKADFSPEAASRVMPLGIGQMARPSDYRGLPRFETDPFRTIDNTVAFVNATQRYLVERTRLGIPALFHDELAHGLLAGDATIFPTPTALASSWNRDLIEQVFAATAAEARARGTTIALTPVLDLIRDPRWGRSEEFFSEDPYLVGEVGVAAVRGLQGRKRPLGPDRVFCTLKHFIHGVPQGGLNISPTEMGPHTLRDTFLVPFASVIREADPAIIMPSYNSVDGVPSHENAQLLQDVGRKLLGFDGLYMSDYAGIENLALQHHVAVDKADAAALALEAGVQVDLPEGASFAGLADLVRAGRLSETLIDEAVAKLLALKFEAGLFENPYISAPLARRTAALPQHTALARKAAEQSIVLLKNEGVLPLDPRKLSRLAIIGPNAVEPLFGGYSGDNAAVVGILKGLQDAAPTTLTIEHADGVWITAPDSHGKHRSYSQSAPVSAADNAARIAAAVEVAKRSDMVLLVIGDVPAITREAVDWDAPGDRSTLGLWGQQDDLVAAIAATGKSVIALLLNGRPLAVPALAQKVQGLFEGWYLGQEGGRAFADILFGKANPSGKLTVSLPRGIGELPVYYNRMPSADVNHYIEGKREALFPFGHGLSYTTFEISAPRIAGSDLTTSAGIPVEVDVTNTGARDGAEIVQLYVRDDVSSLPRPVLELKGFERVELQPGETRKIRFTLTPDSLAFWDLAMKRVVEPGSFTLHAGSSSASLKSTSVTLSGPSHEVPYRA